MIRATGGSLALQWPLGLATGGAPLSSLLLQHIGTTTNTQLVEFDLDNYGAGYTARWIRALEPIHVVGSTVDALEAHCPPGKKIAFGYKLHIGGGAAGATCSETATCASGGASCALAACCDYDEAADTDISSGGGLVAAPSSVVTVVGCRTACCDNTDCDFFTFDSTSLACELYELLGAPIEVTASGVTLGYKVRHVCERAQAYVSPLFPHIVVLFL